MASRCYEQIYTENGIALINSPALLRRLKTHENNHITNNIHIYMYADATGIKQ